VPRTWEVRRCVAVGSHRGFWLKPGGSADRVDGIIVETLSYCANIIFIETLLYCASIIRKYTRPCGTHCNKQTNKQTRLQDSRSCNLVITMNNPYYLCKLKIPRRIRKRSAFLLQIQYYRSHYDNLIPL
jgi:hypothetical protein